MRVWMFTVALMLCPALAAAGAWSRDKGSTFVSSAYTLSSPIDALGEDLKGYSTVYLERGLGRNLTLGIDAGMEANADYTAIFFLRRSLGAGNGPNVFAFQGGLGAASSAGSPDYLLQVGASWGRGMTTRLGGGWAALDTSLQYRFETGEIVTKADLTLGLKPVDRTKLMLQVQVGDYLGNAPYLRIAPSVAREFRPGRHIELGAQVGVAGDTRVGLKLGTWLEF